MIKSFASSFLLLLGFVIGGVSAPFEFKDGDHVSIIGNALADRMQHDGWLETLIQAEYPDRHLSFRNLGFAGDELNNRMRSESFGTPDVWLKRTKADVIFAFFGYNESFAGPSGVGKFKQDLEQFISKTLEQKYNEKTAPRLVLFSPIGHENLKSPDLPDGSANNQNLRLYTDAVREVATKRAIPFVDLFSASQDVYAKSSKPLTINGVHLTEYGNQMLAPVILRALDPGAPKVKRDSSRLEAIRQAVVDKDFYWFNRYRTVDGYNVYGGRSKLKYVDDISNWDVLQREMEVLDVMTANRDKRVWAAAQGKNVTADDSNTPPQIAVKSNKLGPGPRGEHTFLDPEEAIKHMKLASGLKVNLFASEKDFPELAKPVQMAFDVQGRLWVAVWPSYPHWKPKDEMNDKLIVLEDTNGDGKADKCTTFADHLHCPTGFEFYNGGVLVAQAPDLLFMKDTKGRGKATFTERVLNGLGSADTHHTANSFVLDPGGALYFQEGVFHATTVETPYGPPVRNMNAAVYRYEPRAQKFETFVAYDFANPHGHVFDRWGQDFVMDGTGAEPYIAACFSGRTYFPQRHKRAPKLYNQRTRPCPGMEILSSRQFPDSMQGNLLVPNVIGVLGILQYKIADTNAGFIGTEVEPIVLSDDPNFRPSDVKIGPDGGIYFIEWQNPIIGHMQHHLRDPSRDHIHGRIYRIIYGDRPLLKSPKIAGQSIPKLLDLLREPEDRVRSRTRIELTGRDTKQVMAALEKWVSKLDVNDANYQHDMMEALWLHQSHNVIDEPLLKKMLRAPDFRARAAATRVLCYWRDRVQDPIGLLKAQVKDEHPRVRLEAVRTCSFFTTAQAAEVATGVLDYPMDKYLQYTLDETMNTLDRFTKQAKE
jgi:glucose/arabinose dehydrogenase